MSDGQPVPPKPRSHMYLFGFHERASLVAPDRPLAHWLLGKEVEMTKQLQKEIRAEYAASEAYRMNLVAAIRRVSAEMLEAASSCNITIECPAVELVEAYWSGHGSGAYAAYAECAAMLAHITVAAAVDMGRTDDVKAREKPTTP